MEGIASIGHVAIRVKDIDRSLEFYVERLGFPEMFRLDRDDRLWIVYLKISDHQFLELFPDGIGERSPDAGQVGLNHICLEVDDIDHVVAEISARGIPLYRPKKMGADNNYQAWIEDPDGNRIELMQMMPDSLQAEALARLSRAGAPA